MKDVFQKSRFHWLLAGLLSGMFLVVCWKIAPITFLTNDDNAIAFALAGYQTGSPYPYALFTNCILGYAVAGLYGSFPAVPWWAVMQLGAIFLSLTALGATLLDVCARRGRSPFLGLGLFAALLLTLMIQPVVQLTYTVTAAILGAAGACLVAGAAGEPERKKRLFSDILGGALVLWAFLLREETGYAALCFFFAAVLYRMLSAEPGKGTWRRLLPLLLTVTILCGGALFYNKAAHAAVNGPDYTEFFTWRERFTDYPRDTYGENPDLYQSVGWDEPLYRMADSWCFLDERIDSDALQTIVEGSETGRSSIRDAIKTFSAFFSREPMGKYAAALALGLVLCLLFSVTGTGRETGAGRRTAAVLAGGCVFLGGLALCLYLCLMGRFVLRSFQTVALPMTALLAVLLLDGGGTGLSAARIPRILLYALVAGAGLLGGYTGARSLRVNSPAAMLADCRAVNAYAVAHPENTYIRDAYSAPDIDAFTVYPAEQAKRPVNLISWGGCGMRSDAYYRQLAANGIHTDYEDLFRQKDVYFLTGTDSGYLELLLDVLGTKYGAAEGELTDTFYAGEQSFSVYRLVF